MVKFLFLSFRDGVKKITSNPQLIYTIIVAIIITSSFIFIAERFIKIANNAEERLINVRIGSLQDAFVSFAGDKINDPLYLNKKIEDVVGANETIRNFKVIAKKEISDSNTNILEKAYVIIASDKIEEIGKKDEESSFLYSLAISDPSNSITILLDDNGERLFKTARAIANEKGEILGVVISTQTLSLADMVIENDISKSRILLILIIILILFLFFRHSKIIDYMDLYKKLKEIDQLKDDFISMASHELRTPLSIIRGYTEFVNDAPELTAQTKDYISKISISTKGLETLVADILDVSRIEQGRMIFKMEKINPSDIIDKVVDSFVLSAKEKGLNIYFDKTKIEDNQFINIDIERFKQVLINLINNALKYTIKGEIVIKQYREKDLLYIRVSDTGLGMTEEEKAGLFQKFYRIRTKDTQNIRGTGLGLWITIRIVKEMKGNISVESIKDVGSHFIISFPIAI